MMSKAFTFIQGPLIRALIPNAPGFTSLVTALFGKSSQILSNPVVANTLAGIIPSAFATLIGSPLGYSPGWAPVNMGAGAINDRAQAAGHSLGNSVTNLFNDPATPEYPSPAPAGGAPPPSGPAPVPVTP